VCWPNLPECVCVCVCVGVDLTIYEPKPTNLLHSSTITTIQTRTNVDELHVQRPVHKCNYRDINVYIIIMHIITSSHIAQFAVHTCMSLQEVRIIVNTWSLRQVNKYVHPKHMFKWMSCLISLPIESSMALQLKCIVNSASRTI